MNKLDFLKASTRLVDKIAAERRRLHRSGQEGKKLSLSMQKTLVEIDYWKPTIYKSFDRMMNWFGQRRVQKALEELIPSNKECWRTELKNLLTEGNFLQGRSARQTELAFETN